MYCRKSTRVLLLNIVWKTHNYSIKTHCHCILCPMHIILSIGVTAESASIWNFSWPATLHVQYQLYSWGRIIPRNLKFLQPFILDLRAWTGWTDRRQTEERTAPLHSTILPKAGLYDKWYWWEWVNEWFFYESAAADPVCLGLRAQAENDFGTF